MNTNMQGHNHGGKSHLLGMLGIGALVLVVLLASGRSFADALPLAFFLACPLMMVGMMFMMRGNDHQHGKDAQDHQHVNDVHDHDIHDSPAEWQDSTSTATARPTKTNTGL